MHIEIEKETDEELNNREISEEKMELRERTKIVKKFVEFRGKTPTPR
ncbi:MAG TPA: hypothetical protein VFQ59_02740 [Candidatus Paceibacterota bacterium]|nr:hypothetical protein [Candidatus Paceibacterota bacterium]